jgi:cytochrome d ubiquinol oxidase subunit II
LLHRLAETPTALQLLWFILIAVLWTGYLVLEGFDFGVGMLLPFIGKKDKERRAMLSTIGPLWDGNEVWVLTAGGATFAAFPEWYATLFSAAYLPLFLILVGLIIRAVAFEYRGKINSDTWRKVWDWCIILGSWIPAVLWGVAFANLVSGVKAAVDPAQLGPTKILYDGTFWDLVFGHAGFLLLGGLTTAALFLAHGSIFLSLKTDGVVRQRSEALAPKLSIVATVIAAVWVVWLGLKYVGGNHPTVIVWIAIGLAALALVVVVLTTLAKKFGLAFGAMTVALLAAVVTIFAGLFPNVINGSRVTIHGDAIADPIVGAVVLDGVTLDDVVAGTFDKVRNEGLPTVPDAPSDKAVELTTGILEDVAVVSYPAIDLIPQGDVESTVVATFDRVKASGVNLADVGVGVTAGDLATKVTVGVLEDVRDGVFPARGVIPVDNVKDVVDITFARVGAHVADLSQIGVGLEASPLATAITNAVLADVASGTFPAAQVISQDNVVTTVKITLLRLGIEPTDALVGQIVADIQAGSATIGGLPAADVAAQVAITIEACVPQIANTVEALVPEIAKSVGQVVSPTPDGYVVATLQSVADNPATQTFHDGLDITAVVTSNDPEISGVDWNNEAGLANLNDRVVNANKALNALVSLGLLQEHTDLVEFESGDVITGQPIFAAASSPLTLKLMTIVAACLVPIVLAYQAWSIWVFRRRISADRIPDESGLEPASK